MTAADVERLEHERLTGLPPQPGVADLMRELIGILSAAIQQDQAAGTWGKR